MREPIELSQAVIAALPAARDKRGTYRFTPTKQHTLTGLELRITDRGVKTFSYVARRPNGGGPLRATLGKFPQDMRTVEAICAKWSSVRDQVARGENPAEEKRKARAEATVAEAFKAYSANAKKKTAANDANIFRNHIEKAIGRRKLSEVTHAMVKALHRAISQKKSARAGRSDGLLRTADQAATLLASVFADAGYSEENNPARGIKRNGDVKRERHIEETEAPLFIEALDLLQSKDMRDFLLLCLYTGARRGNVMAMKWRNVDLAQMRWIIQSSESKNDKTQHVMLAPEACDILRARKEAADAAETIQHFVFPGTGKSGHIKEPKKAWNKVRGGMQIIEALYTIFPGEDAQVERAQWKAKLRHNFPKAKREILKLAEEHGIDAAHFMGGADLRIHDLRHTLASWQAGQGTSLAIISKSLNHSSTKPTERYAHLSPSPVQAAVSSAVRGIAAAGAAPFKPRVVGLKRATPKS